MAKNPGNWFSNAKEVLGKLVGLSGDGGTFTGSWVPGTRKSYLADGAIALDADIVSLNSTSATTQMTLGAPAGSGTFQRIVIYASGYTNTMDVDAPFASGDATATFSAVGESMELVWDSGVPGWVVIGNNGVVFS